MKSRKSSKFETLSFLKIYFAIDEESGE